MNNSTSFSGAYSPDPNPQKQEQNLPTFEPLEPIPSTASPDFPDFGIEIVSPADATIDAQIIHNRQRVVLELLINGRGVTEAARLANVHRSTIHRWMKCDEQFKAAMRAYQARNRTSARCRMLAVADEAADLVVQRMRMGDLRAALALLRGAGTLNPNASLTQELDAELESRQQDSAIAERSSQGAPVEARVRQLLAALSSEESTRLLQALAESSQPKLPEAQQKTEEPENERPADEQAAAST